MLKISVPVGNWILPI